MGNKTIAAPHIKFFKSFAVTGGGGYVFPPFFPFFEIFNSSKSFVVLLLHSMFLSFPSPLHSSQLLLRGTGVATDLKYMISSSYNPREDNRQFTSVEGKNRKSCLIGKDVFGRGFKMEIALLLIQEECL